MRPQDVLNVYYESERIEDENEWETSLIREAGPIPGIYAPS
jgi:hypothetical protein